MARANLNKSKKYRLLPPQNQSTYPRGICINFQAQIYLVKVQDLLDKNSFWKFYEVWSEREISIDTDSGPLGYVL